MRQSEMTQMSHQLTSLPPVSTNHEPFHFSPSFSSFILSSCSLCTFPHFDCCLSNTQSNFRTQHTTHNTQLQSNIQPTATNVTAIQEKDAARKDKDAAIQEKDAIIEHQDADDQKAKG